MICKYSQVCFFSFWAVSFEAQTFLILMKCILSFVWLLVFLVLGLHVEVGSGWERCCGPPPRAPGFLLVSDVSAERLLQLFTALLASAGL